MRIRVLLAVALMVALVAAAGCKQKEAQAPITTPQPGGAAVTGTLPEGHPAPGADAGTTITPVTKVVVPDSVKGKWSSVVLNIENKKTGKVEALTVKVNGEAKLSGTNMTVKVGDFMPEFRLEGPTATSASNDPKNPAVYVTVFDGGKEVWKGWLYSVYPAIHPFPHETIGITLKQGNKA